MSRKDTIISQAKGVVRLFSAVLNFRMIHSRTVIFAGVCPVVKWRFFIPLYEGRCIGGWENGIKSVQVLWEKV